MGGTVVGQTTMNLPQNEYCLVLKENFLRNTVKVYLVCQSSDGTRTAFTNDVLKVIPEGSEIPVWMELDQKALNDNLAFIQAFKNVYIVKQEFKPWQP